MRDYIIIVSSLGGVFVEEDNGMNPVWGHTRYHVSGHSMEDVFVSSEYTEAIDLADEIKEVV